MAVTYIIDDRDWQPREADAGDGFFRHPDQPIGKDAFDQLFDVANGIALLVEDVDTPEDLGETKFTIRQIEELKEKAQDRLPAVLEETEFPSVAVYDHYPFIWYESKKLNDGDIYDIRRLLTNFNTRLPRKYVAIGRRDTYSGFVIQDTEWEIDDLGFQEVDETEFEVFGYSNTIEDYQFFQVLDRFDVTIDNRIAGNGTVIQVGLFLVEFQEWAGDYWARRASEAENDFGITLEGRTLTLEPAILDTVQVALHYQFAGEIDSQLPGFVTLVPGADPTIIELPTTNLEWLAVIGYIGSSKIQKFNFGTTDPYISSIELIGGELLLGEDGYRATSGIGDSDSPHELKVNFNKPISGTIQLHLKFEGFRCWGRSAIDAFVRRSQDNVVIIDTDGGDLDDLNLRVGLKIDPDKMWVSFPFIPAPSYRTGGESSGDFLHLGPNHETPVLLTVTGIVGCTGEDALSTTAKDGGTGVLAPIYSD